MYQPSHLKRLQHHTLSPRFAIRSVELNDLYALQAGCWAHHDLAHSKDILRRALRSHSRKRGLGIVVEDCKTGNLVAYGQILHWANCAEICDLMVDEACRSQGIGTAMIQKLLQYAATMDVPAVEIGAAVNNPRALALYERLGFRISYETELNLGNGRERVIFLALSIQEVRGLFASSATAR